MSVKAVDFQLIPVRLAAAAAVGFTLLIAVLAFIWGFASAASSSAEFKEIGDMLAWLSPSDPQTHFAAAALYERALEPGDFEKALREYELAAANAPHNYLLWLRLAAVRGRAGDTVGAEAALRQAKHLAPNYSSVQWALGNFLLREGRDEEAYAELRKAVEGDPKLAPLAAATSLQMAGGDVRSVTASFQNSQKINTALVVQLLAQKRIEDAIDLWKSVEPQDDETYRTVRSQFRKALAENKMFRAALELKEPDSEAAPERITNSGFELPVKLQDDGNFEWKVAQGGYPQVGVTDTQKRSGKLSLVVLLSGQDQKEFRGPSQLVAVRPGSSYELVVHYRSEAKSSATFHWEVVAAKDARRLALTLPISASGDWTSTSAGFAVPADTDGIEIRLVRGQCTGSGCNASGNIWFDDINLKPRVNN